MTIDISFIIGFSVRQGLTLLGLAFIAGACCGETCAAQFDLQTPAGSDQFGGIVRMLPNGNFVVADVFYDAGPVVDVGAVYLYRADGMLISALYGSSPNDRVGYWNIQVLSNSNFVVRSPYWDNGAIADAGALTWVSGVTGISGVVSASNSLVGAAAGESLGGVIGGEFTNFSVVALSNGNYVVRTPNWDNVSVIDAGAVTWGNGNSGVSGVISSVNSLVGTQTNDRIGMGGVIGLTNGNYVVSSPDWNHAEIADVGAVTWGDGATGVRGNVSMGNSLIGSTAGDAVGNYGYEAASALRNGNYVVVSPNWHNGSVADAGAVTFGNGATGTVGVVGIENSLVGSRYDDSVGAFGITELSNGNYVVRSALWDNASVQNVGAVTWGSGSVGVSGVISASNSLIGASADDVVGYDYVTPLSNGHYAVVTSRWDNGSVRDAGAVTWGNGDVGSNGVVYAGNSLIGGSAYDEVGYCGVEALITGHYVVCSSKWNHGAIGEAGAVTWRNGYGSSSGLVTAENSLVGSRARDRVGFGRYGGVVALRNGKYVVSSRDWDNGTIVNAGAVTLCDAGGTTVGEISAITSLVGSSANDLLGDNGLVPTNNGGFVVISNHWDNASTADVGAVTWGNADTGIVGVVTPSNSLVGGSPSDLIGGTGASVYSDGRSLIASYGWDNGATINAGAITLASADGLTTGLITEENSVLGRVANAGGGLRFDYDELRVQMVVGQPLANVVTIFRPGQITNSSITSVSPSPSEARQFLSVTTTVMASSAPTTGSVTVIASTGETCIDSTPTTVSGTAAEFSCQMMFPDTGSRTLRAEFFGTRTHGYSSSTEIMHIVNPDSNAIFANGMES